MKLCKIFKSYKLNRKTYDVTTFSTSANLQKTARVSQEPKEPWLKCRYIVVLHAFAAYIYFYAIRINMGVSIVAMVNHSALLKEEENISYSCPDLMTNSSDPTADFKDMDGEFVWSPELQGYILGSSFLLHTIATAPTGKLTELFGCKNIYFWGFFFSTLFTFLTPFAAWCHVYLLILFQGLRGLFQAAFMPAQSALMANWCPKSERSLSYTITLSGSCWGGVLGSYITGLLCKTPLLGGWPLGFFFFGATGLLVSLLMGFFMYESPSTHPNISQAELKYISENQENGLVKKRLKTPWRSVFTSIPVYALACGIFGQMWALTHFTTVHSTFLGTIMHYPIKENGLFSALPFLLQFLTAVGSGWIATYLNNKNYMKVDTSRKFWNFLSCSGYSVCLLGVYFAGCNGPVTVVLSILSLTFTGFGYTGCWVVAPDISPNFAGGSTCSRWDFLVTSSNQSTVTERRRASVNAFACTLGFTSNFILPLVVGFLTSGKQTLEQWHKIIFICIGVVMSSGIIFAVFGSAELQPWNDVEESAEEKKKKTRF